MAKTLTRKKIINNNNNNNNNNNSRLHLNDEGSYKAK